MAHLMERFGFSKKRSCRLVGLANSTAHYKSSRARSDAELKEIIMKIVDEKPFIGLPRVVDHVRDKLGLKINHKKIARLYRELGLQVNKRKRKGRRARPRLALVAPTKPNELWAMDFVLDSFGNARRFRTLNVKDLFTHEAVLIHVDRSITGADVARVLDEVARFRGYPAGIVCDNGTEFTSIAMDKWSYRTKTELKFIQPGKPIQNAFIESFNAIFRNECLNRYWFEDLAEARRVIEAWRQDYNRDRIQKRLGKKTPEQFAKEYAELLSA
jgi:putative transposase